MKFSLLMTAAIGALSVTPMLVDAATLQASPATLAAVLKHAEPGDTVRLAPGTYPPFRLEAASFSDPIIITGEGAILQGLNLSQVHGLTFRSLELSAKCPPSGGHPFVAFGSSAIRFESLNVHGEGECWAGLLIRESSNVVVTDSEFHHLSDGISRLNSSNVTVTNNHFHDLRNDGINGGGGSRITITGNHFTDFRPPSGGHPDAIQVWTTNTNGPASDILISGNTYVRGSGDTSTVAQGIFVTADSKSGEPRMSNLTVVDNVILGAMYNGIMVQGVDGAEIKGNVVAGYPDMESWIRWMDDTALNMSGNRAQNYITTKSPPGGGVAPADNHLISAVRDRGEKILRESAR